MLLRRHVKSKYVNAHWHGKTSRVSEYSQLELYLGKYTEKKVYGQGHMGKIISTQSKLIGSRVRAHEQQHRDAGHGQGTWMWAQEHTKKDMWTMANGLQHKSNWHMDKGTHLRAMGRAYRQGHLTLVYVLFFPFIKLTNISKKKQKKSYNRGCHTNDSR